MTFNYRVLYTSNTAAAEGIYQIHEVYYEERTGEVTAWSEQPCEPWGDTVDELRGSLRLMDAALTQPVLVEVGEEGHEKLVEMGFRDAELRQLADILNASRKPDA